MWLCRIRIEKYTGQPEEEPHTHVETKINTTFVLSDTLFQLLKMQAQKSRVTTTLQNKRVVKLKSLLHMGKKYSTWSDHLGDSIIQYT